MTNKRPAWVQVQQFPNKDYNTSDPLGMVSRGIDEWVYRVIQCKNYLGVQCEDYLSRSTVQGMIDQGVDVSIVSHKSKV